VFAPAPLRGQTISEVMKYSVLISKVRGSWSVDIWAETVARALLCALRAGFTQRSTNPCM